MTATDSVTEHQFVGIAGRVPLGVTKRGALVIEREETPYEPPPWHPAPQPGRSRKTLDRRDITARVDEVGRVTSVTETLSERFDGQSVTGKPFTRWRTKSLTSIRIHAGGKQTTFFRKFNTGRAETRACAARYHGRHTRLQEPAARTVSLEKAADELLGVPLSFDELYPLAETYYLNDAWHPRFLRAFLRTGTPAELTRNLFGTSRYRKDLVKTVAETTPVALFIAWSMRGLVPVDWLVDLMRRCPRPALDREQRLTYRYGNRLKGDLRPHLRGLDRPTLRHLARTANEARPAELRDLLLMRVAPPRRVRSWTELHDHVAAADRNARYLVRGNSLPEISKRWAKQIQAARDFLSGTTPGGMTVLAAGDGEVLLGWGQEMGNCIAGYQHAMHTGQSHLLGIYVDTKLIANAEVTTRRGSNRLVLGQMLGRFNQPMSREHHDDVVAFLASAGVDCSGDYWGKVE